MGNGKSVMSKQDLNIILVAGGTGGHLFSALSVAEELQKRNLTPHFITDKRCQPYLPSNMPAKVYIIDIYLKTSGILNKIKAIYRLFIAIFNAFLLLRKLRPDAVMGFGGYPSFPALFAARLLSLPIFLHESDCFLGKTNSFFSRYAKMIFLSATDTKNITSLPQDKLFVSGRIVREAIRNLNVNYDAYAKVFTIFIFGGSQGARFFSDIVPEAIEKVRDMAPDCEIEIVQQAALEEQEDLKNRYRKLGIKHDVEKFFFNINEIYARAQLLICRAGASTLGEMIVTHIPAILVPYPFASGDHQFHNASAIAAENAGWCYRQNALTSDILAHKIAHLMQNRALLEATSCELAKLDNKDAVKLLVDCLLQKI
jgi:UDP-N-acetylglucosamine--N-acetylmuramyl-(pentapeptide) pyrophosphoryl-undecaprenol N-acetylglucosamine transferase